MKPLLFCGLILMAGLSGCTSETDSPAEHPAPPEPAESTPPDTLYHDAAGVVQNVTPSRTFVVIRHGRIPGFMDAMSMPFAVADSALLRNVSVDDSIGFRIRVTGGDVVLVDLDHR